MGKIEKEQVIGKKRQKKLKEVQQTGREDKEMGRKKQKEKA